MFLRKIEINGFKSFANRTEILINSGVTGVVGPNGSGKSNIADAIRWVLGEQSSKNLRGIKMEDVIFNGTQNKAKKAFCEVALYFDNEDRRIPYDYSEIVIARKMYRSGESEYFLNGASVRLKDILDIIRDTGIGKEGYSIVGQGRIDEILASKPTARRKVFEEAAGIMKFRTRKEEAEHKLEKTDENLVRVEDILEELQSQLEPLEIQAGQTRRYLELFARQKELDASLFVANYERAERRIAKLEEEQRQLEQEIGAGQAQFGEDSGEVERLTKQIDELSAQGSALLEQQSALQAEMERLGGEHNLFLEKQANCGREAQRLRQECQEEEQASRALLEQKEAIEEKQAELGREMEKTAAELTALEEKRSQTVKQQEEERKNRDAYSERRNSLHSEITAKKGEISVWEAKLEGLSEQKAALEDRIALAKDELARCQAAIQAQQRQMVEVFREKGAIVAAMNENNSKLIKAQASETAAEQKMASSQKRLDEDISKKKLLEDLKAEYEGYSDSIRNLMRATRKQPQIREKIRGTLAEILRVPTEYEVAIETLLGGALQNVIVQDEYDAKDVIEFLRRENLGRVTFMPLDALRISYLTEQEKECASMPGFLAVASEAVEFDAEMAPAVEFLLARTVIVDTLQNAISIMQKSSYSFRAVTLKGDIIRPGGTMSGGSQTKKQFGLLSRERNIELLQKKIQENRVCVEAARAELAQAQDVTRQMREQSGELLQKLRNLEISSAEQREKIAAEERNKAEKEKQLAQLEESYQEFDQGAEKMRKNAAEEEEQLQALTARWEELQDAAASFDDAVARAEAAVSSIAGEIGKVQIRQAEISKEAEAAGENESRILEEIRRSESGMAGRMGQIAVLERQREDLSRAISHNEEETAAKGEAAQILREKLLENEEETRRLKEALSGRQKQSMEYQMRQSGLLERKYKVESQLEKVRLAMETAGNKLWEEYEMTYGDALEARIEIGFQEASREVQDIRVQVRELGVINPNAIEDYNRLQERVTGLTLQREDLLKAKADLTRVIGELMNVMRETFQERFDRINENFQEIFQELFGGGRAALSFGEGDIMECGIEIAAEPPGKKLQHISLLSGGERALTAIALLFAMIRINPSPICLLDEIDAPLDEANVIRFSTYLTRIDTTQFIVITHRKPTMTICNALYGVAMEEKGVSKLVSVKLN